MNDSTFPYPSTPTAAKGIPAPNPSPGLLADSWALAAELVDLARQAERLAPRMVALDGRLQAERPHLGYPDDDHVFETWCKHVGLQLAYLAATETMAQLNTFLGSTPPKPVGTERLARELAASPLRNLGEQED